MSKTAVWAALSARETNVGLSDDTRQRVLNVAKRLNYQGNIMGRSLAKRQSFLVSLLCREAYRLSAMDVIRGIQDVLLDQEYSLVTYAHGDTAEDEARHLEFSLARKVDGLIVMPALDLDGRTNHKRLIALQQAGMPIVQLFNRTLRGIPTVMMDHCAAGRIATEHLMALGHRRIAYFTHAGYRDDERPEFFPDARHRYEGYKQVMEAAGLECLVVTHGLVSAAPEYFDAAAHSDASDKLLCHPFKPTGVVCYCDFEALALIREMIRRGIQVPRDISITGVDDVEMLTLDLPSLTTVVPPLRKIGEIAAGMILEQLAGTAVEDQALIPPLAVRGSTGPLKAEVGPMSC